MILPNIQAKRKSHRLIYLNYLPRVIGYFLVGLILFSNFYNNLTIGLSICIIIYALIWPHIARYIGLKNSNPRLAVLINFMLETFVGGLWMSFLSFSLWPTLIIAVAGFANYIITGGGRMVLKVVPFAFIGAVLGGLIWGFHFEAESSLITALLCCLFMLVYISVIAYGFYGNAKELNDSKKLLKEVNIEVKEKFDSANKEIVHRKKVEKELIKVNNDLQGFAYVVSHDLKAPLRGMSSLLHFIKEDLSEKSKTAASYNLDLLQGRVLRLNDLINGILEYTKIQQGINTNSSVMVKNLVEKVIKDLDIPDHFTITVFIKDDLKINFNEIYLYEILSNLISNAAKYNDNIQPIINIGYDEDHVYDHFFVEDNGMGVQDKFKHKIFEMFQKIHARDEIEGSGIGLAIVKRILTHNRGDVWVESSPKQNTFFRFIIPKPQKNRTNY